MHTPRILDRLGPKDKNNKKSVKAWGKQEMEKQRRINEAFRKGVTNG